MSDAKVKVRLLFVDEGEYHREEVTLPAGSIDDYDRLIDFVREDAAVLKSAYIDVERLCAAYRVDD